MDNAESKSSKEIGITISMPKYNAIHLPIPLDPLKKSMQILSDCINSYYKSLNADILAAPTKALAVFFSSYYKSFSIDFSGITKAVSNISNILLDAQQSQLQTFNDKLKESFDILRSAYSFPENFKLKIPNFELLSELEQSGTSIDIDLNELKSVVREETIQEITNNVTNNFNIYEKKSKLSVKEILEIILVLMNIIFLILNNCKKDSNTNECPSEQMQAEYSEVFELYNYIVGQLPSYYELSIEE